MTEPAQRRQRRMLLVLVAVLVVTVVPSIARWQLALLGIGLVGIGMGLIVQGRRRRSRGDRPPMM